MTWIMIPGILISSNINPFTLIWGHAFMESTKITNFLTSSTTYHLQKCAMDYLFKNNKICKHVKKFKNPPQTSCLDVINVSFLTQITLFPFSLQQIAFFYACEMYCKLTRSGKSTKTCLKSITIQSKIFEEPV